MSWRNALLTYEPLREALLKAEVYDGGSPFEQQAINKFTELEVRKIYDLETFETDDLHVLCKSEAKTALPNLSEPELDALVKNRTEVIHNLAREIAQHAHRINTAFLDGELKKSVNDFKLKLEQEFPDTIIDHMLDEKLSKIPVEIVRELLKPLNRGEK